MEDTKIIELYWQRDESAITETEIKYGKLCKQLAKNILGNLEDAEEAVNETYLGLWNAIPPERPTYFKAFVCRITKNIAMTKARYINAEKRKPEAQIALSEIEGTLSGNENIEERYEQKEISEFINEYLMGKDKIKRVMFVKRYWFSDSVVDISRTLGVSESKVKTTLFRMRRELKKYLRGKGVEL